MTDDERVVWRELGRTHAVSLEGLSKVPCLAGLDVVGLLRSLQRQKKVQLKTRANGRKVWTTVGGLLK